MAKYKRAIISGIVLIIGIVAIFALVGDSSHKTDSKQSSAKSSVTSHKDKKSVSSKSSAKASSEPFVFDVTKVLKDNKLAPSVLSADVNNGTAKIVLQDDTKQDFETYTNAYASAVVTVVQAAAKAKDVQNVYIARQVKLQDGLEYAVASYWTGDQIKNAVALGDAKQANMKDVLLASSRYYIGGSVWATFSQQQKNDYTNHQQGGQQQDENQDFINWVTAGTVKK